MGENKRLVFSHQKEVYIFVGSREDSMAGSVNQATGLLDFEDVLRTGARVGQDFQPACVCTNPEATVAGTSGQSRP